jgi:hypothetical protein
MGFDAICYDLIYVLYVHRLIYIRALDMYANPPRTYIIFKVQQRLLSIYKAHKILQSALAAVIILFYMLFMLRLKAPNFSEALLIHLIYSP